MQKKKKRKRVITGNLSPEEAGFFGGDGLRDSKEIVTQQGTPIRGTGQPAPLKNQITPEMWSRFQQTAPPTPGGKIADPVPAPEDPLASVGVEPPVTQPKPVFTGPDLPPIPPVTMALSMPEVSIVLARRLPELRVCDLNNILEDLGFELPGEEYEEES